MSHLRTFVTNTLWMYAAEAIVRLSGFLLVFVLVRMLGLDGLGEYSLGTSHSMILAAVAELGTTLYVIQRASGAPRQEQDASFHAAVVLRLAFVSVAFALFLLYLRLADLGEQTRFLLLLFGCSGAVGSLGAIYSSAFRIRERLRTESWLRVLSSLLVFGGSVLGARLGGILGVAYAALAVATLMALLHVIVVYAGDYVSWPAGPALGPEIRATLAALAPFAAYSVMDVFYQRSDFLMLFYFGGATQLGEYAAAYRVFEGGILIPILLGSSLVPAFARIRKQNPERLGGYVRTLARFFALLAFLIASVGFVFAEPLFTLLLGGPQPGAVTVFRWLVCTLIPVYFRALFVFVYISGDQAFVATRSLALQLAVNLAMNLALIPRYGAVGAAAATLLAEAVGVAFSSWWFHRNVLPLSMPALLWRPLLATLLGGLAAAPAPGPLAPPLFLLVFGGTLVLLRALPQEDVQLLRTVLRRG